MREISFRAKRVEEPINIPHYAPNGWMYGDYISVDEEEGYILPHDISGEMYIDGPYKFRANDVEARIMLAKINPKTICQYTGYKDKNDKKVFEWDIISANHYPFIDDNKQNYIGIVEYIPELASFQYILHCVNPDKNGISNGINEQLEANEDLILEDFEVIGNIYDNPELVGEEV